MVDAVIIGAGVNGLAAAAHLAQRGWSVAVLEASDSPGGAVRSAEVTLPGFRHDLAAMNLGLFAGGGFHRTHGARLAGHGLAFAPAADCFATAFPDGRWLGVSTDVAATTARIRGVSEADAATWGRLLAEFPGQAETLFALLGSPMTPASLARQGWRAWRKLGLSGMRELAAFLLASPRAWLDATFESGEMKALLGAWGLHLDLAPDIAGGALFPYLEGMADQSFGMVIGKGGADTVPKAMVAMIEAAGGSVTCGQRVAGIDTRAGRATGVTLADGSRVEARKAVIAGVAPGALATLLPGGTGDARFDRRMQGFRHAPGTMMIHLAMSGLPDWAAGAELQRFAYVHLAPSLDHMARVYAEAMAGLIPAEPVLVVGQPTAIDPTRAPPGQHILWLQVRVLPAVVRGDAAGGIAPGDWDAVKEAVADRAIALLDRHAPGTSAKVLARSVVSPADLARWNVNLVGGDQLCGSHHLDQNFLFRPGWRTPLPGLYLTGAATWPGAGAGAGSGFMLAGALAGR